MPAKRREAWSGVRRTGWERPVTRGKRAGGGNEGAGSAPGSGGRPASRAARRSARRRTDHIRPGAGRRRGERMRTRDDPEAGGPWAVTLLGAADGCGSVAKDLRREPVGSKCRPIEPEPIIAGSERLAQAPGQRCPSRSWKASRREACPNRDLDSGNIAPPAAHWQVPAPPSLSGNREVRTASAQQRGVNHRRATA